MNGIICVNKPSDWTSFDVVAKSRGILKTRKVGHAGTLDPMATGVLPLFLGNATKVCDIMPNDDKGYIAKFKFGITTDTLDITGTVQNECESSITRTQVEAILSDFIGDIKQLPPMYSAVRINGQRLYDIARTGAQIKRTPREVTVHKLDILDFDEENQTCTIEVLCSKGTYIRTICSDIGEKLNVGATLISLQRNRVGEFTLSDCHTMEQLQRLMDKGNITDILLPTQRVFRNLPKIKLNEVQSIKFKNGVKLDLNRVIYNNILSSHAVFDNNDDFMGIAKLNLEKMELVIEKIFNR